MSRVIPFQLVIRTPANTPVSVGAPTTARGEIKNGDFEVLSFRHGAYYVAAGPNGSLVNSAVPVLTVPNAGNTQVTLGQIELKLANDDTDLQDDWVPADLLGGAGSQDEILVKPWRIKRNTTFKLTAQGRTGLAQPVHYVLILKGFKTEV